ncbi:DUF397 domain-containing protein [Streptosporangium sp. NPDC051022]|uniref:DUF397 domain-containing protein n=1 Tax=Streptosporangium sp. NPDC051022 TaxID=3155752 RepID=UPI0034217537
MEAETLIGPDLSRAAWRKSSLSGGSGGNCVEVATGIPGLPGVVAVRDSKNPAGPALVFTSEEWDVFLNDVKSRNLL